jgi:PmbA protein
MTMKKDLLDLAEWSIKTAKSAGADDCRVGISSGRSVEISYRVRKPENIKEASTKRLFIEVFANKRYSGQSTSDLRKDALKEFITNAVATTKLLAEDPFRTLPDPKYYQGRSQLKLGLVDPQYEKVTPEERHAMAKTIEDTCLTKGGSKVVSVEASVSDDREESVLLTSNGFQGENAVTSYSAVASVTLQDEGDRRPNGYSWATTVARRSLPPARKIGEDAVRRTLDLLGGKKIKTETLPVIIENRSVAQLLNGLLAAMFARSIQQKRSFLADKQGKKIASEQLTLIEDPLIVGALGSRLYDDDGFVAKRRVMIESGVLREFYIDWYYGRKLGWEPTTGGPSNLTIPPGKRSVREIMKDLGRGIFVTGFIGGNSNSTTGDASIGILGQLFEHGEPVQAVAEMNIADNHLKFWQRLAEVGNDPWYYSPFRMPSLVFTDVVVSGL